MMGSVIEISCPACGAMFSRPLKQVNQVVKHSGVWRCKKCVLTERNRRNAKAVGSTRVHAQSGYVEEKTEAGWRRQHIVVMERHIGRPIRSNEAVHHVNEIKTDNRLENLKLMDHGEHTAMHHTGAKRAPDQRSNIRNAVRASTTAKLTMDQAMLIRRIARKRRITQGVIARHFSVSRETVSRVVNNHTWSAYGERK